MCDLYIYISYYIYIILYIGRDANITTKQARQLLEAEVYLIFIMILYNI